VVPTIRNKRSNGAKSTTKTGLCTALGTHVFDYGHKAAADQMRTSWEKLAQYCGTINGQNILNKLSNRTPYLLQASTYTSVVLVRHQQHEKMLTDVRKKLQVARENERKVLEQEVKDKVRDAPMKLARLEGEITKAEFEMSQAIPTVIRAVTTKLPNNFTHVELILRLQSSPIVEI
jgi:hypothetical protein